MDHPALDGPSRGDEGLAFLREQTDKYGIVLIFDEIVNFWLDHGGTGALYDVVAPTKNMIRKAGQWNTVTITARGPKITVEMNGEKILDTKQTRSMKGHIGLQNHDGRSVVKYRNIRIEEL